VGHFTLFAQLPCKTELRTFDDKKFLEWKFDVGRQFLNLSPKLTIRQWSERVKQWRYVVSIHCYQQLQRYTQSRHDASNITLCPSKKTSHHFPL